MFKIRSIIIILSLFIVLESCKESNIIPIAINYTYTPLEINNWVTYEIEEITIDEPSKVYDTLKYFIKEIITETFIDISGDEAYRIERFYKEYSISDWIIKDVWSAKIDNNQYQKTEENIKYIRLVFPTKLNEKWNGNTYNIYDELEYYISSINESDSVNSLDFDSVLTVTHEDELIAMKKQYSIEKFAKNIGLIYKEFIDIYADVLPLNTPIEERIITATIYNQKVIGYGQD